MSYDCQSTEMLSSPKVVNARVAIEESERRWQRQENGKERCHHPVDEIRQNSISHTYFLESEEGRVNLEAEVDNRLYHEQSNTIS